MTRRVFEGGTTTERTPPKTLDGGRPSKSPSSSTDEDSDPRTSSAPRRISRPPGDSQRPRGEPCSGTEGHRKQRRSRTDLDRSPLWSPTSTGERRSIRYRLRSSRRRRSLTRGTFIGSGGLSGEVCVSVEKDPGNVGF